MRRLQRTSPFAVLTFAVVGVSVGLLLQFLRSTRGEAPIVPPLSLAATLVVLGAVLLSLAIALRRAVTRVSGKPVNPFHAVRILAGARAAQFVGALLGGFGAGLLVQVVTRTIPPPPSSWLPMLLTLVAGLVLLVCAVIAETLCRVPPSDESEDAEGDDHGRDRRGADPEPDAV